MSKKLAPLGEVKRLELHEALDRVAEVAMKARDFLSEYLKAWKRSDQGSMWKNLKYNEPRFAELMEDFHCAMEDFRSLVKENDGARLLAYRIPSIKRGNLNTRRVLWALQVTSRVANEWLVAHPVDGILVKTVGYFLDRMSDRAVVGVAVVALLVHWRFVLTPKEREKLSKNDWK